jgi:8-oxo-dGTP diphosphatase
LRALTDIDWRAWRPTDVATLLFVVEPARILLIRKKRGLGAGKVNGPGGRLEPGETPIDAAIREVGEELCVVPHDVAKRGELAFQFTDGYALFCHVFTAAGCAGEPQETDEAVPLWTPLDAIPYGEMWADDELWIPHMLAGRWFSGRFIFDRDAMLDHEIVVADGPCPA